MTRVSSKTAHLFLCCCFCGGCFCWCLLPSCKPCREKRRKEEEKEEGVVVVEEEEGGGRAGRTAWKRKGRRMGRREGGREWEGEEERSSSSVSLLRGQGVSATEAARGKGLEEKRPAEAFLEID